MGKVISSTWKKTSFVIFTLHNNRIDHNMSNTCMTMAVDSNLDFKMMAVDRNLDFKMIQLGSRLVK